MKNDRLNKIKKVIELKNHKSGHLIVKSKIRGKRVERLTNIHSDLTSFERNCVLIYVYKLIDQFYTTSLTKNTVSRMLNNTNYAKVFGSPWLINEQGGEK